MSEAAIEEPWALPEGWRWARLGSLGAWNSGGTPKSTEPDYYGGDIQWFRITDLNDGRIRAASRTLTDRGLRESSARIVAPPFIMFAMYGASIGKMAISEIHAATNQAIACCRPSSCLSVEYLFWALQRRKKSIIDLGQGGAQPNISQQILLEQSIPLAPLAEQRRIVARIDALFAEIAEGEAALAAAHKGLETFRRALLKAAVSGELTSDWREANRATKTEQDSLVRLADVATSKSPAKGRGQRYVESDPLDVLALAPLPRGWAWAELKDLIVSGPTNGYSPKKSTDGSGTLALKLTATTRGQIDLSERAVKSLSKTISPESDLFLKPGDLLFQRGNTIEYVGIAAVYAGPANTYVYPDLMIRVRTESTVLTEWIWRVANSPSGRKYMMDNATGTAGTMPKVSGAILRKFPVPVPPPAEAAEILRRVSDALAAAAETEALLDAEASDAARLKQSILKAAFEGRLVAQDAADESATLLHARLQRSSSPKVAARARSKRNS